MNAADSDLDLVALAQALDDHEPDREHWLDVRTGAFWTFAHSESTDETRARHQEVRGNADGPPDERSWVRIPSMTTQQAYEEVEDFVEQVVDGEAREVLFGALEKRGALRNFRETLMQLPEARQQWMAFRRERSRARVDAFLQRIGLAPTGAAAEKEAGARG